MTEVTTLLQRFHHRYRRALLARIAVLATLAIGLLGVLAWRLAMWQVPVGRRTWMLAGLGGLTVLALGWWVHRRWISPRATAAHLDRALGLQQRLVTAAEFADSEQASSLYPLLVEDAVSHCATGRARFPRPWDRLAAGLVVLILLLLLLPRAGIAPTRLAQLPPSVQPPPEPKTPPPPQSQGAQSAQSQQPQSGASDRSQGGQSQPQQGQQGKGEQPSGNASPQNGQSQPGDAQQDDQRQQSGSESQQTGGSQSDRAQQQQDAQRANAGGQQAKGAQRGQQSDGQGQQPGDQRGAQQQANAQQGQGKGGTGLSPGNQEALKAEIQGLLKQVSGELKELQAQLENAQDLPKPEAGTSTDPELYGRDAEPPSPKGSREVPVQLQTDEKQVKTQRPGGGTGKPSTAASAATPKTKTEAVALSEAPLEETATSRQSVPPEYRGVFDRVHRPSGQPTEQEP